MKIILTLSRFIKVSMVLFSCLLCIEGYAQNATVSENEMTTIFTSGGYGALFGAAMGAAILPFINESPMENIRLVAGGASIGFMVGSLYGFYNLANAGKNSYFNYNIPQEDDNLENNYYYSMPSTYPTQGNNNSNSSAPLIGALIMNQGNQVNFVGEIPVHSFNFISS